MVNAAKFRRSFRAARDASEAKRTMSVLENLPSLIDRPRRSRRRHRPDPAKPTSSSSVAPTARAPSSAPEPNSAKKEIGDGAAGGQQPLHHPGGPSRSSRSVGIAPPSFARARDHREHGQRCRDTLFPTYPQLRPRPHQGKRDEAHDLLAPVYGWFTEGFDTPVLKKAKLLLEQIAA